MGPPRTRKNEMAVILTPLLVILSEAKNLRSRSRATDFLTLCFVFIDIPGSFVDF